MHLCSPSRRHKSSYLFIFCRHVSHYFIRKFSTSRHCFCLTYYLRRIVQPVLWYFGSCSSESGTSGQPGCPSLRQIFWVAAYSGPVFLGGHVGKYIVPVLGKYFLGLSQRCLGSHISRTGVAVRTRGQARRTRFRQILMGSRISGPGSAGRTRGQSRRTRLRQIF